MEIGELRHRIALSRPVTVSDGAGGFITTWEPVATVWAAVQPQRTGEGLLRAARPEVGYTVTIRYRADISAGMHVVFRALTLEALAVVNPDARSEWLEMVCRAVE